MPTLMCSWTINDSVLDAYWHIGNVMDLCEWMCTCICLKGSRLQRDNKEPNGSVNNDDKN